MKPCLPCGLVLSDVHGSTKQQPCITHHRAFPSVCCMSCCPSQYGNGGKAPSPGKGSHRGLAAQLGQATESSNMTKRMAESLRAVCGLLQGVGTARAQPPQGLLWACACEHLPLLHASVSTAGCREPHGLPENHQILPR